jgi:hypothetical protein
MAPTAEWEVSKPGRDAVTAAAAITTVTTVTVARSVAHCSATTTVRDSPIAVHRLLRKPLGMVLTRR